MIVNWPQTTRLKGGPYLDTFMMICGSCFEALLLRFILYRVSDTLPAVLSSRWLSILIPSALIILPLSLLPSMVALAATSTLALAVYSFNITAVAREFIEQLLQPHQVPLSALHTASHFIGSSRRSWPFP